MKIQRRMLLLMGATMPIWCLANEREQGVKVTEQIYEIDADGRDGFIQPIGSLATIGEKLNVLIRVKKDYPYTANLVFVVRRDQSEKIQDQITELFTGVGTGENFGKTGIPYPIKLRFQIDSVDVPVPIHVDQIHDKREDGGYLTYYPSRYPKLPDGQSSVIWRAQGLWGIRNLEPGVYRIRIENLRPTPEVDFETLLQFYVNRRKA